MDRIVLETVLKLFEDVICMRSVEYFADRQWEKLPPVWISHLSQYSDAFDLVSETKTSRRVLPLSIIILKQITQRFGYSRVPIKTPKELENQWSKKSSTSKDEFPIICSKENLRKRIKPKKQHEIDRMVELVTQVQNYSIEMNKEIDSLIDIGSGVGHLSRIVALNNNLATMAVEGNEKFTKSANDLDKKLIEEFEKTGKNVNSAASPIRLTSFVNDQLAIKIDNFSKNSAILVGLHTCGDFSSIVLNVFKKSQKSKALILLGCCYHKQFQCFDFYNKNKEESNLEESKMNETFPLSKKWEGCKLKYSAKEIACHNNEGLKMRNDMNIARYARAHLEYWIWKISDKPVDRNIGMNPVKCDEKSTTFEEYIQKAMKKRGSHLLKNVIDKISVENPELLTTLVSELPRHLFDFVETIKLMFAPLIESAIIDDRLEYLRENGIVAQVVPLFDPIISPRNLAIIANKF